MYLKTQVKTLIKREGGLFLGGDSVTVSVIFSLGFCQALLNTSTTRKWQISTSCTVRFVCIVSDNVCKEGVMSDDTHVSSFQPLSYVYCQ